MSEFASKAQDTLIVIPCLNEQPFIESLLNFCLSEIKESDSKIVIADGGSTDGTLNIINKMAIEDSRIILLDNPKRIQSSGVNLAVKTYGEGFKYFIRMDVHADYPQDYISELLTEAKKMDASSVVVTMDTQGTKPMQSLIAMAQNSPLGNGGSGHRNGLEEGMWVDHGHHALMKVDTFLSVDGYDESFSHNEDAELDTRIIKAGGKIWLTSATQLIYYPRERLTCLFKQYRGYGSGRCRNLIKHKTKPHLRQMIPVGVFPALILASLVWVSPLFLVPFVAWLSACLLGGIVVAKKSPALSGINKYWVGIPAATMHLAWSLGYCQQYLTHHLSPKHSN